MDLVNLHHRVLSNVSSLQMDGIISVDLKDISSGAMRDVLGDESLYYRYLTCLVEELKPKQIVELGGAMGVSALMMVARLPQDHKLFSITLPEGGLEFSFIKKNYPQIVKVIGDDLDLGNWPRNLDFGKTDLMFIDTYHDQHQLRKEVNLYFPLLPKGCLVLFDDIYLDFLLDVWKELDYEKLLTPELHHSGFGILRI